MQELFNLYLWCYDGKCINIGHGHLPYHHQQSMPEIEKKITQSHIISLMSVIA